MNINWKVRIRNKNFWITIVPALIIAVQLFANIFGVTLDFGDLGNRIVAFINALFVVLALMGVVNDPTTASLADSSRAMTYTEPKEG
ncbi:MAG: phage holin [Olsenella sp.]|nr:phage holin [Olsenella sp.]